MSEIRVAIVEDEGNFATALVTMLEHSPGYTCLGTFRTLRDARRRIPELKPQIVLVDLHLPDGTGVECIRDLSRACPSAKSLVVSKFDEAKMVFDAICAGAYGYVLKGDGTRAILDGIDAVARGLGAMSPSVARRAIHLLKGQGKPEALTPQPLTDREGEVLELVREGKDNVQIAARLGLSPRTVANHLTAIYDKLHVTGRHDLVASPTD